MVENANDVSVKDESSQHSKNFEMSDNTNNLIGYIPNTRIY